MQDLFKRVITAKELQEKEDFKGGNEWLIEHLIPRGQAGLTIAPQKSFKSSTTLQMALSVAKGVPFGYFKTKKANVLIIDNEDTDFVLHQRLKAYNDVPDNLHFITGGIFKLDNTNHMNGLYKFIKDNNIKFVILDNLKDMLTDRNTLNDMSSMNDVLNNITRLKLLLNDVTFLLIAHARKDTNNQSLEEKSFRVRSTHALGSSAIGAWFEFCLCLSPKMGKNSKYSILTVEARNYAYDKEVCLGYVGEQFQIIDPTGNKPKEILEEEQKEGEEYEETKNEAESLLTVLKQNGKLKEIND